MIDVEALLDSLAERVAERLEGRIRGNSSVGPRLFTVEQAAVYFGRTREAVQHLVASGKIPAVRLDRRVYVDRKDLDRLIEESKVGVV